MVRKIELEIPAEIYTDLSEKIEDLEKKAEKKITELEEKLGKTLISMEKSLENLESRFIKDLKRLEKKIEKRLTEDEKKFKNRLEEKEKQFESDFRDLEKSIEESFNQEASYVKDLLQKFAERLSVSDTETKEISKSLTQRVLDLKKEMKITISELRKSVKEEINKIKTDAKETKKELLNMIKAIDKRVESIEKEIGNSPVLERKRTIKKSLDELETRKNKSQRTSPISNEHHKKKTHAPQKVPEFLKKLMNRFGKHEEESSNKWIAKIERLRKRKSGKAFVVAIAKLLRDYLLQKFGIRERLTYMETVDALEEKGVDKKIIEQIKWFFEEVTELEYSNEDSEERFPDIDIWASKIILHFESKMIK